MRNKIIILLLLLVSTCFAAVNVKQINYDTVTGPRFDRDLRKWIGILNADITNAGGLSNIGTGKVFYVDSAAGGSATSSGTSPASAVPTLDDGINLCTADRGDIIFVMQGHAETIDNGTSDAIDFDVAGVTVIGLGYGSNAPEFTFDTTTDEIVIDADNVVVYNLRLLAGISEVVLAFDVKDGADDCAILRCFFPEPTTSSWEFDKGIVVTTADRLTVAYNTQYTVDEVGATNFLDNDGGVTAGLNFVGNICIGEYSEGIILSDDADLENYIAYNDLSNLTSGQHAIEFTAAATGTLLNNTLAGDTLGSILDPGSMRCFGNTQSLGIDTGAIDVPLVAGKKYSVKMTATSTGDNLFDVDGGAILITSFTGLVTTNIGGVGNIITIELNADAGFVNYDFSTAVETNGDVAGTRYSFTDVILSVLTPMEGATGGGSILMGGGWFCGEGMIEQTSTGATTGAIVWYMSFIPLDEGVTVVPQ